MACRSFPNKLKRLKHIRTKDRSYLNPDEVAWQELPREQASTLVLSFCLTSSVSNKYVFDMCMLPQRRERGCSSAKQILLWSGQIQQAVCDANCGIPSDGIAFDNATSNGLLNSTVLGTVEPDPAMPFWKDCEVQALGLHALFPYQKLVFRKKYQVKAMNGGFHVIKRLTCHAQSGSRTICWGAYFCDMTNGLLRGMPLKSYSVADPQSDKESQQRICPRYFRSHFDGFGCRVTAFVIALVMTGTVSAWAYSPIERARNFDCKILQDIASMCSYLLRCCQLPVALNFGVAIPKKKEKQSKRKQEHVMLRPKETFFRQKTATVRFLTYHQRKLGSNTSEIFRVTGDF